MPAAASPAVEILLNTELVAELIEQGDIAGVKEAMEKSLAEGSQTFEQDIARLITEGVVSRDEGMAHADSPTNLIWRLHNDMAPVSARRAARRTSTTAPPSPKSRSTCAARTTLRAAPHVATPWRAPSA